MLLTVKVIVDFIHPEDTKPPTNYKYMGICTYEGEFADVYHKEGEGYWARYCLKDKE